MISPFLNCGLKRTFSRPLPPTVPPPPQSQNQLRRRRSGAEACRRHDGPRRDGRAAQQACDDHRFELPLCLLPQGPCRRSCTRTREECVYRRPILIHPACCRIAQTLASPLATPRRKTRAKRPRFQHRRPASLEASATLAGPEPRSNPRNRDQGVEIPCLFAPVRFQPHALRARLPQERKRAAVFPRTSTGFPCLLKRRTTSGPLQLQGSPKACP